MNDIVASGPHCTGRAALVEPAVEELARRRATLGEIMRRRGVTDRGQLVGSFRDEHGLLAFLEALRLSRSTQDPYGPGLHEYGTTALYSA